MIILLNKGGDGLKIIICDDSSYDTALIRNELNLYMKDNSSSFEIKSFLNPEAVMYELQDNCFADIYILDVSMPDKNGFELAEEIRHYTKEAIIIFLTTMENQASLGYKVKAFRYISKINIRNELPEALKAAEEEIESTKANVLTVRYYNDYWRIPHKDIISVTRVLRQLQIETVSFGSLTDNRGIKELFNKLDNECFLFVDRSSFININHIKQISGNTIKMQNGKSFTVSRRTLQNFKQELMSRWE